MDAEGGEPGLALRSCCLGAAAAAAGSSLDKVRSSSVANSSSSEFALSGFLLTEAERRVL